MKKLSEALSSQTGGILFDGNAIVAADGSIAEESPQPVWVDGKILRRFFSVGKGTEASSAITTSGPLLKHKHLLCDHGTGLHPSVARRGKLLPRPLYDAIVSLMLGERQMLNGEHEIDNEMDADQYDEDVVNDCIITPDHNMYCENCVDSYKTELREKIDKLCRLRQLYHDLDPKSKQIAFEGDDEAESEAKDTLFLVSKKFITNFRKRVVHVMDSAGASEIQSHGKKKLDNYCEGLDSVNLTSLGPNSSDDLDSFVNSTITCKSSV